MDPLGSGYSTFVVTTAPMLPTFNRRTATLVSHGFARLIEQAVKTRPTTYREIIATPA